MVKREATDGRRIGELLASEIHGHERDSLDGLSVVDADREVEPTEAGAFAFAVAADDGRRVADVYVHPDRIHAEFRAGVDTAAETAEAEGLGVRPKAVEPPRTLVFVETAAEVKMALRVVRAVAETLFESPG